MPKLHRVSRALKDYPDATGGPIKKGDPYFWVKKRIWGAKSGYVVRYKKRPKRSALTGSAYLASVYDLQDEDLPDDPIDLHARAEEILEELERLKGEAEESLDAMPEQFKETSASGVTLSERIEALDTAIFEIEMIDLDEIEGELPESDPVIEVRDTISSALMELG